MKDEGNITRKRVYRFTGRTISPEPRLQFRSLSKKER